MRAVTRFLAALGVLLIVTMPALSAQHPQTRDGFWIGFGFGYGSRHETCTGCGSTNDGGVTGFLKLGGTLSKSGRLGGAVNAGPKAEGGLTGPVGNATASVYNYPAPAAGCVL